MVESNERTLAKGEQSGETARSRLSSDFSRSDDDLDLMREFHVGAPSATNLESSTAESQISAKQSLRQGSETLKRVSQDESVLMAKGILPNSQFENTKSFAEPAIAKNILKESSSSLVSEKRSIEYESSESLKSKMANSIPMAKEIDYKNDFAIGSKFSERDLQGIQASKQIGSKDDLSMMQINKESFAQAYESKNNSKFEIGQSIGAKDVSAISTGRALPLQEANGIQMGRALPAREANIFQAGQPNDVGELKTQITQALKSKDIDSIQMGQSAVSKEVYKEMRSNAALEATPIDKSLVNNLDKPNRDSLSHSQLAQRYSELTQTAEATSKKGIPELGTQDGGSGKADLGPTRASSETRGSLETRSPTAEPRAQVAEPRAQSESRAPVSESRAPVSESRAPVSESRAPVSESRTPSEVKVPAESLNRLAPAGNPSVADKSSAMREAAGDSSAQSRLAPKTLTESIGRDAFAQPLKDPLGMRPAEQVSLSIRAAGALNDTMASETANAMSRAKAIGNVELNAVLLQSRDIQDAAASKIPSTMSGGITLETGVRRSGGESGSKAVIDVVGKTVGETVGLQTASGAAARATTDGAARTATDGAVRTATDSAARTATDSAARTATDGAVRTATDGAVRTAPDGAVRTATDGAARTTAGDAVTGRPLPDGIARSGEIRSTIDGLSVRPTTDGVPRSERTIGQPIRRGIDPVDSSTKRYITGAELAAFLAIAGIAKVRTSSGQQEANGRNPNGGAAKSARDLVVSTIDSGRLNSLRGMSLSAWLAVCSAENSQAAVHRSVDKLPHHEERLEHDMTAPAWFANARKRILDNQSSDTGTSSSFPVPVIPELTIVGDVVTGKIEGMPSDEAVVDAGGDKKDQSEAAAQALYRPTHLISRTESLVSIAEKYFDDARLGWLIANLNADKLKETWFEGKRVVEIRSREKLELPVEQDIMSFFGEKLPPHPEKLITIVVEGEIDKEVVSETLRNVFGTGT